MGTRLELHDILTSIVSDEGKSLHVYFNPPENLKLAYPCIVYSRQSGDTSFADNKPYFHKIRYQVMLIDKNPDSAFIEKIMAIPSCIYSRHYTQNNLNHDVFNLYY